MRRSSVAALALVIATSTHAEEGEWPRDYLTLGVGVGTVPRYSGSDENMIIPALAIRGRVHGFAFVSRGTNFSVDLARERAGNDIDLKLGPLVNLRTERSARAHDVQVDALGKRPRTLEAGGFAGIAKRGVLTSKHDQIGFRVSYVHDVLGKHGSYVVVPSIDYGTPLSRTTYLGTQVSMSYVGKGYGRQYYDVDAAGSAASGLAVYAGAGRKAGFAKMGVTLAAAKSLSGDLRKGWTVVLAGQYGRMLGRYARSPIVADAGSEDQWLGGLGLAYTF